MTESFRPAPDNIISTIMVTGADGKTMPQKEPGRSIFLNNSKTALCGQGQRSMIASTIGKCSRKEVLMDEKIAEKIVEKIIEDLSDRDCLRCKWEQFDDDLRDEIRQTCREIILKIGSAT